MNEGGCSAAGQRARHNSQRAKLIVVGASELVDVQGEAKLLVKNDPPSLELNLESKCLERQWQQRTGQHQPNVCHLPAICTFIHTSFTYMHIVVLVKMIEVVRVSFSTQMAAFTSERTV